MPSGPQTAGAAAGPAHPSVRVSFPASVYPLAETGVLTCFVGAPDVSFISVLKMLREPEMKGKGERHAEMTTILRTIKKND